LTTQTATAGTDGNSDANTTTGQSPVFAIDVNGTGVAKDNNTIDAGFKPFPCPTPAQPDTIVCHGLSPSGGFTYVLITTLTGGTWAVVPANPAIFIDQDPDPTYTNAAYGLTAGNTYTFVYNNGVCVDTARVNITLVSDACTAPAIAFDTLNVNMTTMVSDATSSVATNTGDAAGIIGGEVDVKVQDLSGQASFEESFSIYNQYNKMEWINGVGDFSIATVTWDGNDNDANTLNATGLGGIDISTGGNFGFLAHTDIGKFKITLRIYTNAANYSQSVFTYNQSGTPHYNIPVEFTSFTVAGGTGADMTNVGAVQMIFEPLNLLPESNGIDFSADCFHTPCVILPTGSVGNYVWNDTDGDGLQEVGETGINGITVELWNNDTNTLVSSTATANDGSGNAGYYNFVVTTSGNYYVKFPTTNGATVLTTQTATAGTDGNSDANTTTGQSPVFAIDINGTGVAKDNNTIDAGYKASVVPPGPTPYTCSDIAKLATPMFVNGDPLAGTATGASNGFMIFNYDDSGMPANAAGAALPSRLMGSVWGLGYKSQNQKMYASAFMKRHAGFGPLGIGGIYEITPQGVPSATNYIDVTSLGVNVGADTRTATASPVDGANELATAPMEPSWDRDAFGAVGKRSLGGLDISTDGSTLYTMNLFERKLTVLNISGATPTLTAQVLVPDPGCSNGDYRPFAVKYYNNKVYVGTVCSAETSQDTLDLKAYVQSYDGSVWQTVSPAIGLEFPRGYAGGVYISGDPSTSADWRPWHDTYSTVSTDPLYAIYPQPILSDIEIDMDGSMVLAFTDRNSHQVGGNNYTPNYPSGNFVQGQGAGDVMRLCANGGSYVLENGAACNGGTATHSPLNGQGPGGGEFYWGDMTPWNYWQPASGNHEEAAHGGLAFKAGSGEVVTTAMNPTGSFVSGGVIALNNTNGERNDQYQLFLGADQFGKVCGLGDLEMFCTPAVEYGAIGNYVWFDEDADGILDNNAPLWEGGINGVIVKLYKSTDAIVGNGDDVYVTETVTARDATSANGYYYFSNLVSGNYYVQFQTSIPTNVLAYSHVLSKQTQAINTDNDSDANQTTGNSPMVTINTTLTGVDRYNYTIDAAYTPTTKVGNYVWLDGNSDGAYNDGVSSGINNVVVELWSTGADGLIGGTGGNADVLVGRDTTSNNASSEPGYYLFDKVVYGNYYVKFPTSNGTNILTTQTTTAYTDWNSDANTAGNSPVFAMDALHWSDEFKNNMTLDAGYKPIPAGSVGNYVWSDTDGDGIQDAGETGINGVVVQLWSAGSDNAIGGPPILGREDILISTTTTSTNGGNAGYYNFSITTNGNYYVKFPTMNGANVLTTPNPTAATDGNSDANQEGNSAVFSIDINGTGTNKDNPTIDAGYTPQPTCVLDGLANSSQSVYLLCHRRNNRFEYSFSERCTWW
jgi:hypothetical protein